MEQLTISKLLLDSLLRFAEQRGFNKLHLLNSNNLFIDHKTDMLPFKSFAILYEFILQKVDDSDFGFHLGSQYNLAALGIVGQLIQVSRTIQEGIEKSCTMFNLISNALHLSLHIEENHFVLKFEMNKDCLQQFPLASKHLIISSMVFAYQEVFFLTKKVHTPLHIETTFSSQYPNKFEALFNSVVQFDGKSNHLIFDIGLLSEPIIFADYELLLILEKVACQRLTKQLASTQLFSDKIKAMIYSMLNPHIPSFETIAQHLNMSPRNVQRKLKAQGTSYSLLTEEIKKELAVEYLKEDISIKEVSYLMGYTESSSFVNAFKKWFGKTPRQFKIAFYH